MEQNSNNINQKNKRKLSAKAIWGIVFALSLAIAVSAGIFVSNLKKMTPTEDAEVIALVPEDMESSKVQASSGTEAEEADSATTESSEVIQVPVPQSSGSATQANAGQSIVREEKRLVDTLEAEMSAGDEQQVWTTETSVDIFDEYYKGTKAAGTAEDTTVENSGSDEMNLIAPGTEKTYTFWVKNTGEVGIDYEVSFEENQYGGYDIPLEVRVKCGNDYILGDDSSWVSIHELDSLKDEGHLRVKNYAQYSLEWRWPFETDDANDVYDTSLGDEAVLKNLEQEIIIRTYGEGDDKPIYEIFGVAGVKTGDSTNILLWFLLAVIAGVAIIYIRRRTKKNEQQ